MPVLKLVNTIVNFIRYLNVKWKLGSVYFKYGLI